MPPLNSYIHGVIIMIYLWLIMIFIAILEVPGMLRRKHYRTLLVFALLWLLGATTGTLFLSRLPFPDVFGIIIELIK